jgi:hypothetical protein
MCTTRLEQVYITTQYAELPTAISGFFGGGGGYFEMAILKLKLVKVHRFEFKQILSKGLRETRTIPFMLFCKSGFLMN